MPEQDRVLTGRMGLTMGINYFTILGYTISLPLNDTQWYDFVAEKDGIFYTVQCKATKTQNGIISFRSTGGTKGSVYDNILNHNLDFLFCIDAQLNMWCIPMKDIRAFGNCNSISLRLTPTSNGQGFQTYKYKVKF